MGKGTTMDQIKDELRLHGPIAAGMCVNSAWVRYNETKGVLPASEGDSCTKIGHDVNYVGWGTDATTGLDYWLVSALPVGFAAKP
jgi:hypothetical protein